MTPPRDREDLYAALGVSRTATGRQIDQAFRALALELHPDRNPGNPNAEARFKLAARAYTVLRNPEQRAQYDERNGPPPAAARPRPRPGPAASRRPPAPSPAAPPRMAPGFDTERPAPTGLRPPNFIDRQLEAPGCGVRLAMFTAGVLVLLFVIGGLLAWASDYFRPRGDSLPGAQTSATRQVVGSVPVRSCSNGTRWYTTAAIVSGGGLVRYVIDGVLEDVPVPDISTNEQIGTRVTIYASELDPRHATTDPCGGGVAPR